MEKEHLNTELAFIRKQMDIFDSKIKEMEKGNWRKYVSDDNDKSTLNSGYHKIYRELNCLLRYKYDIELH